MKSSPSIKGIPPEDLKVGDWRSGRAEIEGWGDPGGPGDEEPLALPREERELDVAGDEVGELVDRFD
jgi:hypothetical protein